MTRAILYLLALALGGGTAAAGTSITFNGVGYTVPAVGDASWGTAVSTYLIAIASGSLQKSGGAFTLTAEVDFGATYGVRAPYFRSKATNTASAGAVRLGNTETVSWRNAANSGDRDLSVNSSDNLTFAGLQIYTNAATSSANGYLKSTDWTTFNAKVSTTRSISTTAPLSGGGDLSADRTLSIPVATSSANGYLSSTDWATFNAALQKAGGSFTLAADVDFGSSFGLLSPYYKSKASHVSSAGAVRLGNTETVSWRNAANGGDRDLSVNSSDNLTFAGLQIYTNAATGSANGYLSSTDWSTFNTVTTRTIATTAPLAGGGTLAADRTFSIPVATTSANGYLSSTDWTTFNNKDVARSAASASVTGYLTSTDWTTFNNKDVARSAATASVNGYLTSTDWTTFNSFKVMTSSGDMIIGGASGAATRLAVDSTTTHVLHAGSTPAWGAIAAGDLPGTMNGTTFSGGVTVGGNTVSDTNLGTISNVGNSAYYEGSFTITASGITGSPTGTTYYIRSGKTVTILLPNIVGTASGGAISFTGLPSGLSPARNISAPAAIKDNGTWQIGRVQINASATSIVIKVPSGSDVSGAGSSGIDFGCFTYLLN